ncbi:unnamed protein product [Pleuronectes platessa]|uniref:Uncharacterized protein n=1 Tax=Pleuronectes platessa TaxID=8262 RepID=A0A9N7YN62_PLEPL|nr:unnamed protein product [Pleuronectes platessa]
MSHRVLTDDNQEKRAHFFSISIATLASVAARIRFKTQVLVYRAAEESGPVCIQDMANTPAHPLRYASANQLAAPSLRANHSTKSRLFAGWMKSKVYPNGSWVQGFRSPFSSKRLQQFGHRSREEEESYLQYHISGRESLKMAGAQKKRAMESR